MPQDLEQIIKNFAKALKDDSNVSEDELIARLAWLSGFTIGKYMKDHA